VVFDVRDYFSTPPALAGSDCCTLFGGLLELDDYAAYEQLVIDNEIAGNILRILQGIHVDEDTLALDVIAQVGHGGNFLDTEHTFRHYRREQYTPQLADRNRRAIWEAAGGKDFTERARDVARKIPAEYTPSHMPEDVQRELEGAVRAICKREGVDYTPVRVGP
jgi:trimethylamine--corrinoid protein Co-methyltransferase